MIEEEDDGSWAKLREVKKKERKYTEKRVL